MIPILWKHDITKEIGEADDNGVVSFHPGKELTLEQIKRAGIGFVVLDWKDSDDGPRVIKKFRLIDISMGF